jgi:hypothetical protein
MTPSSCEYLSLLCNECPVKHSCEPVDPKLKVKENWASIPAWLINASKSV